MNYSEFAPRLYHFCKQYGLRRERWKLASACCPDEDQGYPLLILTKHFGTFPVNVGTASGGINYAEMPAIHDTGTDLIIVQASHLGFDSLPDDREASERVNGERSRAYPYHIQTLRWYQNEYRFARNGIALKKYNGRYQLLIDNQLLEGGGREGLFLNMDKLVQKDEQRNHIALKQHSTAKAFMASDELIDRVSEVNLQEGEITTIGRHLSADLFYFKRNNADVAEQEWYRIRQLNELMPQIITASSPALELAKASIQIEFDHTFRTLAKDKKYQGRNLVYIGVVHQDAAPSVAQTFTPVLVVPWAAYIRQSDGRQTILEQPELVEYLKRNSAFNPDEIDLDLALQEVERREDLRAVPVQPG